MWQDFINDAWLYQSGLTIYLRHTWDMLRSYDEMLLFKYLTFIFTTNKFYHSK